MPSLKKKTYPASIYPQLITVDEEIKMQKELLLNRKCSLAPSLSKLAP